MIKTKTKTKKELRNLDRPSLVALGYILRHQNLWPENFSWDFGNCDNCAMGLAHKLWPDLVPEIGMDDGAAIMAKVFVMSYAEANDIFLGQGDWMPIQKFIIRKYWWKENREKIDFQSVTPEMVADQIDEFLRAKHGR